MTDQEKNMLAEYSKETDYPWTLEYLIYDHRNLANERIEVEAEARAAKAKGYGEGLEHGLRSCEILEGLTRREE